MPGGQVEGEESLIVAALATVDENYFELPTIYAE